jgi:hypothetical protein
MPLTKTLLLAIIPVFIQTVVYARDNKPDTVQMIVDEMAVNGVYKRSYTIGYTGSYCKQLELYTKLLSVAAEDQLIELAKNNKSAVVRLYAFQALKEKKAKIADKVVYQFEEDNAQVITLSGCFGDKKQVKSLAFKPIIQPNELLP